jgi:putative serine protease PepD
MKNPLRASRARIAAVAAAVLFGAGAGAAVVTALDSDQNAPQISASEAASPIATSTLTVGEIYERSAAGVVEITVGSAGAGSLGGGGATQAQGSGFVYDNQGHIITNQHVVDGAESVSVRFSDGSTQDATVVGTDPSTDLAVLEVDAPASLLKPLRLGKSSELAVGDGVIAIGSPFGLEQTVTTGIVSALNRQINSPNGFAIDDAIQTDAAINHGNSGGPLLDLDGRVIGVNSQIESESGGNDGIGFAVPSDTVARIAADLIADGEVEHAYLGVATGDTSSGEGASIAEVRPGTPAAAAGLREGDVVTEIDGEAVADADELRTLIDAQQPGDSIELTIVRDGDEQTIEVELAARPSA